MFPDLLPGQQSPVVIGCAFLNRRGSLASGGWACAAGGKPFKFTEVESLRQKGGLWVVSSLPGEFLVDLGQTFPWLLHGEFLPTSLDAIAYETGQHDASVIKDSAARVAEILGRVVAMGESLGPVMDTLRQSRDPRRSYVTALQAVVAPPVRRDPVPPELEQGLRSLFTAGIAPIGQGQANDIAIRIPANRVALMENVMMRVTPGVRWTEYADPNCPNLVSWAVGHQKPVVGMVTVKAPLKGARLSAPVLRSVTRGAMRWMSLPEMMSLSGLVEMSADRLYLADETVSADASMKVPTPMFGPAAAGSVSAQLLAEAYLHAAAAQVHIAADADGFASASNTRAAFVASAARGAMMSYARQLSEAGFPAVGFGLSHVMVSIQRSAIRDLRKFLRAPAACKALSLPAGLRSNEVRTKAPRVVYELDSIDGQDESGVRTGGQASVNASGAR